jgi:hypothetical protein
MGELATAEAWSPLCSWPQRQESGVLLPDAMSGKVQSLIRAPFPAALRGPHLPQGEAGLGCSPFGASVEGPSWSPSK